MQVATKKQIQIGYQAPKGARINRGFMSIETRDFHYCWSHDFWFDPEEQKRLLHEGKPCFYTDGYIEGNHNSYRNGSMLWKRKEGFTLKKAIRLLKRTRNLPVGTVVNIVHNWYYPGKKINLGYTFKVRKENKFDPEYEVRRASFFRNFNTDEKAKNLVELLRANGFLVSVFNVNPNHLMSMISTAASYMGKDVETENEEGEYAIAYGHGLKVGFSSNKSTLRGYSQGVNNVLFDKWDEFDKWSRCREISKETPNEEILQILLNDFTDEH